MRSDAAGLYQVLMDLVRSPEVVAQMGEKSREFIRTTCNPMNVAMRILEGIERGR